MAVNRKNSELSPITAIQARNAAQEGYVRYTDPTEGADVDKDKQMTMTQLSQLMPKFTLLDTNVWDGTNKYVQLIANRALTFAPGNNLFGQLDVQQNGIAEWTITINGTSVPIDINSFAITTVSYKYDDVVDKYIFYSAGAPFAIVAASDTTPPTVLSATAIDSSHIRIIFSEATNCTTAGWTFKKNGSPLAITSVTGGGTTWTFLVASMLDTDIITRSYTSSTGNTVDLAVVPNELVSFTDQSVTNSIGSPPTQLSTPGSFAAAVDSSSQITCTWADVANESSYTIDRSTASDFSAGLVSVSKSAGSTSHVWTGLADSTHYYFRLKAVGDGVSFTDSNYALDDDTTSAASFDTDAQALFDFIEITLGETIPAPEKTRVNTWFTSYKAGTNPYAKVLAAYLFVGGTTGRRINAVNPANTDAAKRIVPQVGCVLDTLGITTDGVDDYYTNNVKDGDDLTVANFAISMYNRISRAAADSKVIFGDVGTGGGVYINLRSAAGNASGNLQNSGDLNFGAITETRGHWLFNHRVETPGVLNRRRVKQNNALTYNVAYDPVAGPPTVSDTGTGYFWGCGDFNGTPVAFENAGFGIKVIFDSSLTDAEETQVYNADMAYVTDQGRLT